MEQLRLEIFEGNALQPRRVRLLIYTDTKFGPAEKKALREEWMSHRKALRKVDIEVAPASFLSTDTCSLKQYRDAIPIDVPSLDRGRFV